MGSVNESVVGRSGLSAFPDELWLEDRDLVSTSVQKQYSNFFFHCCHSQIISAEIAQTRPLDAMQVSAVIISVGKQGEKVSENDELSTNFGGTERELILVYSRPVRFLI